MRILFISSLLNCSFLFAQYDAGTIIYNQTSNINLTSILKNYIVEDFDNDFNADIIMVKSNAFNNSHYLTWYKSDGGGNFSIQANLLNVNDEHKENEIFYEDMNGDGHRDIVFQNNDTGFKILINDGQGNISSQINNVAATGNLIGADLKEIADVDSDGDMDGIFWAKTDSLDFYGNHLGYCLIGYNNSTGILSNYNYLENNDYSIYHQIETGDIDGDGDLDIICNGTKFLGNIIIIGGGSLLIPFVKLYKNSGQHNYTSTEINLNVPRLYFTNIKMQDINKDNTDELLVEYSFRDNCEDPLHGWGCEDLHQFEILSYNAQNEAFVSLEVYNTWLHNYHNAMFVLGSNEVYNDAFYIQFGNQNADNNLDVLSVNVTQGRLQWYLGDGDGGFNNTQVVNFNNQYSSIQPTLRVADIDNDTDLDIFVLLNDDNSSTLTVFKNLTLSPSCAPILDLADTSLTDGIYQAGNTLISSGNVVAGNNNIVLKAGNNVKLESGFKVPASTSLKIRISSCN